MDSESQEELTNEEANESIEDISSDRSDNLQSVPVPIPTTRESGTKMIYHMDRVNTEGTLLKMLIDIASIVPLFGTTQILQYFLPPPQKGFFCDDLSIRYPYREKTIGFLMLVPFVVLAVVLIIVTVEWRNNDNSPSRYYVCNRNIPQCIAESYKYIGYLVTGVGIQWAITLLTKKTLGKLRPHFIQLCEPVGSLNCSLPENFNRYVSSYVCKTKQFSPEQIDQARESFPSGYASLTGYVVAFAVLYLQYRFKLADTHLIKPTILFVLIFIAFAPGCIVVMNFRNHLVDTAGGYLIGCATVGFTVTRFEDVSLTRRLRVVPANRQPDRQSTDP